LRRAPKTAPSEIPATEFKARCLELMREVHDRRRNYITITRRGRPLARLVPVPELAGSLYGCLKGQAKIHGDLTEPVDVVWEALQD